MSADVLGGLVQAGGSAMRAFSGYQDGRDAAATARRNARARADAMAYNAGQAQREGLANEALLRQRNRAELSRLEAARMQSGTGGAGTAVNLADQNLINGLTDVLQARANYNDQAGAMRYDARNTLAAGLNEAASLKASATLRAAGHLMRSAASLYGVYGGLAQPAAGTPVAGDGRNAKALDKNDKARKKSLSRGQGPTLGG